MGPAERYRRFAEVEAAGSSPSYERLCGAIADDELLMGRIGALPAPKQQPNLVLAACKFLGAPFDVPLAGIGFMHDRWAGESSLHGSRPVPASFGSRTKEPGVIDTLSTDLSAPPVAGTKAYFVLGIGGERVAAISDPHGSWLRWSSTH